MRRWSSRRPSGWCWMAIARLSHAVTLAPPTSANGSVASESKKSKANGWTRGSRAVKPARSATVSAPKQTRAVQRHSVNRWREGSRRVRSPIARPTATAPVWLAAETSTNGAAEASGICAILRGSTNGECASGVISGPWTSAHTAGRARANQTKASAKAAARHTRPSAATVRCEGPRPPAPKLLRPLRPLWPPRRRLQQRRQHTAAAATTAALAAASPDSSCGGNGEAVLLADCRWWCRKGRRRAAAVPRCSSNAAFWGARSTLPVGQPGRRGERQGVSIQKGERDGTGWRTCRRRRAPSSAEGPEWRLMWRPSGRTHAAAAALAASGEQAERSRAGASPAAAPQRRPIGEAAL